MVSGYWLLVMDVYTRAIMVMAITCGCDYWLLVMDIYIRINMVMVISYG
jgi:hypothetical protein